MEELKNKNEQRTKEENNSFNWRVRSPNKVNKQSKPKRRDTLALQPKGIPNEINQYKGVGNQATPCGTDSYRGRNKGSKPNDGRWTSKTNPKDTKEPGKTSGAGGFDNKLTDSFDPHLWNTK